MMILAFPLNVFVFAVPFVALSVIARRKGWIIEDDTPFDQFTHSHIDDDDRYEPGTEDYFIHR